MKNENLFDSFHVPLNFTLIAMEQWNGEGRERERRKKLLKIGSWKRDKRLLVPVAK